MLNCHVVAFLAGFLLDLLMGDPHWLPHPIRLIGGVISRLEKGLNRGRNRVLRGTVAALLVILVTALVTGVLLTVAYGFSPLVGVVAESVMTYQILATKCLKDESMKVYDRLMHGTLEEAREAVSMIVGRDTQNLDEKGITKAAVETVAENTSDGCIAPMLYLALGGPLLGFVYKAINTMDSMIGYKNERYLQFGRFAARLDDVVNYLPSRISAMLLILSAFLLGKEYDGFNAWRIFWRDRRNHASPNSAQTEAACAGALRVQLAGDASYFGKLVKKPTIGDDLRPIEPRDVERANRLLYLTAGLCQVVCLVLMMVVIVLLPG